MSLFSYHGIEKRLLRFLVWWHYKANGAEGLVAMLQTLPPDLIGEILRSHGATVDPTAVLHSPLLLHNFAPQARKHFANLSLGAHCYLGRDIFLDLARPVVVEEYATLSMRVTVITHTHAGYRPEAEQVIAPSYGAVHIERGAYIGAAATLLQGVTIGAHSVVGAGAVVIRSIPPNAVAVGVPARVMRTHTPDSSAR